MMDFEGIEKVRERVSQNGTLYQQLQQMAQQLQKMAAIIDQQNGTNVSAAASAARRRVLRAAGAVAAQAQRPEPTAWAVLWEAATTAFPRRQPGGRWT